MKNPPYYLMSLSFTFGRISIEFYVNCSVVTYEVTYEGVGFEKVIV